MADKYLTVSILKGIRVNCFKVEKKNEKEPDYRGDGVAIWINEKKEQPVQQATPPVEEKVDAL